MASLAARSKSCSHGLFRTNRFLNFNHLRRTLPFVGLSLLVSACGHKQAPKPPPPPQVGIDVIHYVAIARNTDLPGRTTPVMISPIRPQVSGVILKRLFVEGSDVKAGQQLYQIDPSTYQATYDTAVASLRHDQASLAADRSKVERYRPLAAAQAISRQDYDNAVAAMLEDQANIASDKASIEQAAINLQYTRVLSPISGTIGASLVTPGALVTANQSNALDTVTTLDPIYVDVNESSTTWLRLKQEEESGQLQTDTQGAATVSLTLEDGTRYPLTGKMQFSEVNVDEQTGTVLVRAIFPNPNHLILPGMYVHATVDEGINKNGILVPQQAVSFNTHGDAVVLLVGPDNKAVPQIIQVNGNLGQNWIVTEGLKPGDKVIVDGLINVMPGKVVSPVDKTDLFSTSATH
jgi:membrane fusion protein (multidrug efflux system)